MAQMECTKCNLPMEKGKVTITYLESSFPVELLRCPQCGLVYIPRIWPWVKCSRWKNPGG